MSLEKEIELRRMAAELIRKADQIRTERNVKDAWMMSREAELAKIQALGNGDNQNE